MSAKHPSNLVGSLIDERSVMERTSPVEPEDQRGEVAC